MCPIYSNKCNDCDNIFESVQSMSDNTIQTCPKCKSINTNRFLNFQGSIVFEGTGWTPTHYPRPLQKHTRYR